MSSICSSYYSSSRTSSPAPSPTYYNAPQPAPTQQLTRSNLLSLEMSDIEQNINYYEARIQQLAAEAATIILRGEDGLEEDEALTDARANSNWDNGMSQAQVVGTAPYDEEVAYANAGLEPYGMALQADAGQSVPVATTASGGMHYGTCQCEECAQPGVVGNLNDMSVQEYEYEYATYQDPSANEFYEGPRV